MKKPRVEIVQIVTDIPNAIIVDGKRLKRIIERKDAMKIHFFFIGLTLGYFIPKLF